MRKIGPKMEMAVSFVRQNPGCSILPVAEFVGPRKSRKYGYQIVHRAIKAKLIKAEKNTAGIYSLFVR